MKRITEVARQLGVCAATVRRLEANGQFLPTRDRAGQRRFSNDDVARLRAILYPATPRTSGNGSEGGTALAAAPAA